MVSCRSYLAGINGSDEGGREANGNDEVVENDDDYSSDFEESNASIRVSPRAKPRGGQDNTNTAISEKEKKLSVSVEDDYGPELPVSIPSALLGSHPLPSYSSSSAFLEQPPPNRPNEERKDNSDAVLQAEMALQPLRSSLAKSLLSSQVRVDIKFQ